MRLLSMRQVRELVLYSAAHKATIKVISFQKMLRDAGLRNQVFFDQLKLGSPSLAAKKRAAGARERRRAKDSAISAEAPQPGGA